MSYESTREHPRFATEVAVKIEGPDGVASRGRTHNVSSGGLSATVDKAVPKDSVVRINIALIFGENSVSEYLPLTARVVWCTSFSEDKHQLGTSFLQLNDDQRGYVDMFLRYLKDGVAIRSATANMEFDDECGDTMDLDESEDPFAT